MTTEAPDRFPTLGYASADPDTVIVIDEDEAAPVRQTPSHTPPQGPEPAARIERLREGAMLFIPSEGHASWHARMGDWPARNGYRVRQRRSERNGVLGHYVWLEAVAVSPRSKRKVTA